MNKEGEGFVYLRHKFPRTSEAKIKEGIFVGPQVKQPFQDPDFRNQFISAERNAWEAFENACSNFLGNKKIRKLRRICGGATFLLLCLGVQHVIENPFPATSFGFFPGKYGCRL